jgi:hypothetical protein
LAAKLFFTCGPEIRLKDAKDITELTSETVRKESLQTNKGGIQNVFQRSASGERDATLLD